MVFMKEIEKMLEHFALLETTEEHRGYFFSVQEAIAIVYWINYKKVKRCDKIGNGVWWEI